MTLIAYLFCYSVISNSFSDQVSTNRDYIFSFILLLLKHCGYYYPDVMWPNDVFPDISSKFMTRLSLPLDRYLNY